MHLLGWVLFVLLAPDGVAQEQSLPAALEQRIRQAVAEFQGTVCLYAKNLDGGAEFGLRADERVRTASTIKLPILAAVFAEVTAGRVSWDEQIMVAGRDKIGGSGVVRELTAGTRLTLHSLAHLMIVVSDNSATNLILDRVPADMVNGHLALFGLMHTRALRKVLGPGGPAGLSREGMLEENRRFGIGVSTPRDMVILLEKLERGEVVNSEASREMIEILKRQQYKDGIGRKAGNMVVASKSGALDRLRSDIGIVYSPGGRIAIAITCDDLPQTDYSPDNAGNRFISELAGLLVEGLAN